MISICVYLSWKDSPVSHARWEWEKQAGVKCVEPQKGMAIKELASTQPDRVLPGECGLVGMVSTDLRQEKYSL